MTSVQRSVHHTQQYVSALRDNLGGSRRLIEEIDAELDAQATNLERIKAEAEANQRLAEINKEAAQAVTNLVAATIQGARKKASRLGNVQQWLFFLAGLLLSIAIGLLVNYWSR